MLAAMSEAEVGHEPLRVGVMPEHFAIEALAGFPLRRIAARGARRG